MENLNAEQVKKALECCALGDCTPCPYHQLYVGCRDRMAEDALALINSQEQRIGELAEENEKLTINMNAFGLAAKRLGQENERLRAENERYAELEEGCYVTGYKNIKADTVREMQERLDKRFCHDPAFLGVEQRLIMDVIDQIAKEMIGDAE